MEYFFSGNAKFEALIDNDYDHKKVDVMRTNLKKTLLQYGKDDDLKGKILITLIDPSKQIQHSGIKISLVGQIKIIPTGKTYQFTEQVLEPSRGGILFQEKTLIPFHFIKPFQHYETFIGEAAQLQYFLRVQIQTKYPPRPYFEQELYVFIPSEITPVAPSINLEFCVERNIQCGLHLRKSVYCSYGDLVMGDLIMRNIKMMLSGIELHIIRKESWNNNTESQITILKKFEIMDGIVIKGEKIPIRLPLKGVPLTSSYKNIGGVFSVDYFISVVIIDTDERRYFAETPIIVYSLSTPVTIKSSMIPPTLNYNLDKLTRVVQPTIPKFSESSSDNLQPSRTSELAVDVE
ncbi:vacuolar protein sorting-associated protein, putative [Entamoeba invadens IP1]|uniref:vacuolar protein sorting-associated protein, putative n=1 Tax=Entamoeba invadens IP1 TaxID=370355 RepID=UPI0002C3F5B0|nr:vacuolar protein sorting-associated protein, putative [Entamoeba invadens IP1]ELP85346.1 vacuolar protein sorting-associated protein, putative [Entamoeba invadens IP1]|eukprot:XP_004184692.1 vacuolar protein sorting-associated protein, putative [Entamoeba invadens IP1]